MSSLARESVIAGLYFSQTSVICFRRGFSCCPLYRGVRYSEVSARWELTVFIDCGLEKMLLKILNFFSRGRGINLPWFLKRSLKSLESGNLTHNTPIGWLQTSKNSKHPLSKLNLFIVIFFLVFYHKTSDSAIRQENHQVTGMSVLSALTGLPTTTNGNAVRLGCVSCCGALGWN